MNGSTVSQPPATVSGEPEVLIKVENVGKVFCRDLKKSLVYGAQDALRELLPFGGSVRHLAATGTPDLRAGEFWANQGISFELRRGECLGLIGHNGAGKTTLLKMLNGLIKPDTGNIEMHGRVGALIALGAGFNPILTGRENVYVNASVLGISKAEIDEKLDDIIEFAGIREFIDTPVQSYSSGMQVRLGFAVATALRPDILILDEVLAVGDRQFQIKCMQRIGQMMEKAAVIFVSHQMELVKGICQRILVLDHGRKVFFGNANEGIDAYQDRSSKPTSWVEHSEGITSFTFEMEANELRYGQAFKARVRIVSRENFGKCKLRLCFEDNGGRTVAEWNSTLHGIEIPLAEGPMEIPIDIPTLPLGVGRYTINANVQPVSGIEYLVSANAVAEFEVVGEVLTSYAVQL